MPTTHDAVYTANAAAVAARATTQALHRSRRRHNTRRNRRLGRNGDHLANEKLRLSSMDRLTLLTSESFSSIPFRSRTNSLTHSTP